ALLYTIAFSVLPEQWAWRSLFWVGVLPALRVLYIRKHVPESEILEQARNRRAPGAPKGCQWLACSPALLQTTRRAALLCTGIQGVYYADTTWLPTYLKVERHLSVLNTGGYLLVIILGSFCGYIAGAHMADRLGRRVNFLIYSVLSGVCVYFYTQVPLTDGQMLFLGFPLGFAASGIFGGLGAYLTELFPSEI